MAACPDEEKIARFVEGRLDSNAGAEVEAHIDLCPVCARIVTELARFDASSVETLSDDEPSPNRPVRPGAFVGRYQILRRVGAGSMGDVYLAYDPELDRSVAVKLLRRDRIEAVGEDSRRARLQREALALARLSHPNAMVVHDVGLFEGHVFIAMEFVDGGTLGAWLKRRRRTWSQLRPLFLAAGRGLQAAHAAGLVHRDFKPDNVLLGSDGRVRVTDFGLARLVGPVAPDEAPDEDREDAKPPELPGSVDIETLTATGALVGTPAYMAPEQFSGRVPTAAGDQYSFCVALFEALAGRRPFVASSLTELADKVTSDEPPPLPRESKAPRRVRLALRRGLARDPSERFETMDALLAVLERETSWHPWAVASAGATAVVVAGGLFGSSALKRPAPSLCRDEPLAAVWNDAARERMQLAFAASGLSYAKQSLIAVERQVAGYVAGWSDIRAVACVPDAHDEGQRVLQRACLERRRDDLSIVLDVLATGDPETIQRAASVTATLPDIEQCRDPVRYQQAAGPPPPLAIADAVEAVRSSLAEARALEAAGKLKDARAVAAQAVSAAQELGHQPAVAEALQARGVARIDLGEIEASAQDLELALTTAIASHHRRLAAEVMVNLVFVLGHRIGDTSVAEHLAAQAEAEIRALGGDDQLRSGLLMNLVSTRMTAGRLGDALVAVEEGLAIRRRGGNPVLLADSIYSQATLEFSLGRYDDAERHLLEAREIYETELGPDHPALVDVHQAYGQTLISMGRFDKARAELELARAFRLEHMGPDHPEHATTLGALAILASSQGRLEEALRLNRETIEFAARVWSEGHPNTIRAWLALGDTHVELEQFDRAEEVFMEQERMARKHLGPEHPVTAEAIRMLGWLLTRRDEPERALPVLERALALFRSQDPHDEHLVLDTLARIAETHLELEHYSVAVTVAQEALTLCGSKSFAKQYAAALRVVLAMARWELGEQRQIQLDRVRTELESLRATGAGKYADAAEDWLANR